MNPAPLRRSLPQQAIKCVVFVSFFKEFQRSRVAITLNSFRKVNVLFQERGVDGAGWELNKDFVFGRFNLNRAKRDYN